MPPGAGSLLLPSLAPLPLSLLFSSRIGNELVLLSLSPLAELVMSLADQERERLSRLAVRGGSGSMSDAGSGFLLVVIF